MTKLWSVEVFRVSKFENHLGSSSFGVGGNFPAKAHVDRGVDRAVDTPGPQVDRAVDLGTVAGILPPGPNWPNFQV